MNSQEVYWARLKFKNKIYESEAQAFEDLFTKIMNYRESDFVQVKPYGNIGDRKVDGYIHSKGIYFQVYAPENPSSKLARTVAKIIDDFEGLKSYYDNIKTFAFVFNDKYHGVHPDLIAIMNLIREENNIETSIIIAKDLEKFLFDLTDDELNSVLDIIMPSNITTPNFEILNEIIDYILTIEMKEQNSENLRLPDFENKIRFNGLSEHVKKILDHSTAYLVNIEEYFSSNGDFIADIIREKLHSIYLEEKESHKEDDLFWAIFNKIDNKKTMMSKEAVACLMTKYFETCDIFEEPI